MNKYYAVLGLPVTASKDEIRKKYRQLVLIWHPDRNSSPEAQTKFIAITEAYDVLMGERPAPRSQATYSRPRTQTPTQQRTASATRAELMRKKFEKIRSDHRNSSAGLKRKAEMETKARKFFTLAACSAAAALVIPFLFGSPWHLIWTLPVGIGIGAQALWRGGRFKIRTEMIFGSRTHFTDEEIADFFMDRPGFGRNFAAGKEEKWW